MKVNPTQVYEQMNHPVDGDKIANKIARNGNPISGVAEGGAGSAGPERRAAGRGEEQLPRAGPRDELGPQEQPRAHQGAQVEGLAGLGGSRGGPLRRVHAEEASANGQRVLIVRQKHLQPSGASFNALLINSVL